MSRFGFVFCLSLLLRSVPYLSATELAALQAESDARADAGAIKYGAVGVSCR